MAPVTKDYAQVAQGQVPRRVEVREAVNTLEVVFRMLPAGEMKSRAFFHMGQMHAFADMAISEETVGNGSAPLQEERNNG